MYLSISSFGASFGGAGGPATTTAPGATVDGGGWPGTVTMTLVGGVVQVTMIGKPRLAVDEIAQREIRLPL